MDRSVIAFPRILEVPAAAAGEVVSGLSHVQEFLKRFGYLTPAGAQPDTLDETTAEALSKFQSFMGLQPTGTFDEATKERMTTPRCALADMKSGLAFSTTCAWSKTDLTFAFDTGTDGIPANGEFDAVRAAFMSWAAAAPLIFKEVSTGESPDIQIGWRPAADPDHSMTGGVLAHADFPPGCSVVTNSLPKPVHFDDEEHTWAIGAVPGAFDVETVALHEIGHILGLAHSSVPGAVMAPTVAPNFTLRTLQPDDVQGVQNLYGSGGGGGVPSAPPWPGRYFRHPPITKGDDVRLWQERIAQRGFTIKVDGLYGPQSRSVCIAFQQQQGIQADGIVGPVTWERTFAS